MRSIRLINCLGEHPGAWEIQATVPGRAILPPPAAVLIPLEEEEEAQDNVKRWSLTHIHHAITYSIAAYYEWCGGNGRN